MSRTRRIALLMGQDLIYCRDILRGVRAYAIGKQNWVFHNAPPEPELLRPLREWNPHGMIALLVDQDVAQRLLRMRKPLVDIACTIPGLEVPTVDVDHLEVGRLAAEHFLERGFFLLLARL